MVKKLHNSLVEFVVLAGFDNYTGLISTNTQTQEINKQNIFENTFEPSVLSVISHDKAYYPSSKDFNLDYPHIKFNKNDLFNSSVRFESFYSFCGYFLNNCCCRMKTLTMLIM